MRLKTPTLKLWAVALFAACMAVAALAADNKPNILVIWGDDIGYWNISAYNQGMMGYKTPNIDRIAKEGALYTDWPVIKHARPAVQLCWPCQSV